MQYWPVKGKIYWGNYFTPACSSALFPAVHIGAVLNNHRKRHTERKKERQKERFLLWNTALMLCASYSAVQRVDQVICLNRWLHTSEWQKKCLYPRGWRYKCRCDFTSETAHWCCCRRSARGTSSSVQSVAPFSSFLRSLLPTATTKTTLILSLSHLLQSGLNWTCPVPSRIQRLSWSVDPDWLSCLTCMCASLGFLACRFVLGRDRGTRYRRGWAVAVLNCWKLDSVMWHPGDSAQRLSHEGNVWRLYPCLCCTYVHKGKSRPSSGICLLLVPWCLGA